MRLARFPTLLAKAAWLDAGASLDSLGRVAKRIGARYLELEPEPAPRAMRIQADVRDRVKYKHDRAWPGANGEEFASSRTILERLTDDCDGKSRLFVALCRASNLEARIRPVFRGPDFVHVQAQVRWPGSERWKNATRDGWVLAELIVEGVGLGDDPMKVRPRRIV